MQLTVEIPKVRGLPLVGNLTQIRRKELHLCLRAWCDEYGPVYSYRVGTTTLYVIADLDLIHEILKRRPHDFRRTSRIETIFKEIGTHGVFSTEGEDWRRQRRLIMPAFHQGHLKDFFDILRQITRRLKTRWDRSLDRDLEVCKDLTRYTVDVTTRLAFDYNMNTLEKEEDVIQEHLEHIFPAIDRRLAALIPYWRYVRFPEDRALDRALKTIQTEIQNIVESSQSAIGTAKQAGTLPKPRNMAESFLISKDPNGVGLTMQEVLGNVFTMLVAGEDTTATSIAWTLVFMLKHPEVVARMEKEAREVLKEADTVETYEDLDRLRYTEAVILESMRLKPVAPVFFFETCKDLTLGSLTFKKGSILNTLVNYPSTQEEYFSHAHEFRPERWLCEERPSSWNHEPKAFLPFGGGARVCPGRTLAVVEMKTVLSMLCKNFRLMSAKNGRKFKEEFRFSVVPTDLWVRLGAA